MKAGGTTDLRTGRRDNFFYLFAALMVLTVAGPVLEESLDKVGAFLAETSLSITLVIALWSLKSSRLVFLSGLGLIAVNVLATGVWLLFGSRTGGIVSNLSGLVFLGLTTSDATDPLEGFNTFFNDREYFKHLEIGWTGASQEAWFLNNVHLTLWQADEREEMGVEDGWGGVFSFNHAIGDK